LVRTHCHITETVKKLQRLPQLSGEFRFKLSQEGTCSSSNASSAAKVSSLHLSPVTNPTERRPQILIVYDFYTDLFLHSYVCSSFPRESLCYNDSNSMTNL